MALERRFSRQASAIKIPASQPPRKLATLCGLSSFAGDWSKRNDCGQRLTADISRAQQGGGCMPELGFEPSPGGHTYGGDRPAPFVLLESEVAQAFCVHLSTTWSARPSSDGGIVRPRALAVLRLMTSSNFVGCSTGRSPGFVPLRILST